MSGAQWILAALVTVAIGGGVVFGVRKYREQKVLVPRKPARSL